VDTDWALSELRKFIELTTLRQPSSDGGIVFLGDFASPVGRSSDIIASAQVVEKILDRVLPRWRAEVPDDGKKRWARHRQAAIRAVTELERQAEIAERLGDNAPTISATGLHAWVWARSCPDHVGKVSLPSPMFGSDGHRVGPRCQHRGPTLLEIRRRPGEAHWRRCRP